MHLESEDLFFSLFDRSEVVRCLSDIMRNDTLLEETQTPSDIERDNLAIIVRPLSIMFSVSVGSINEEHHKSLTEEQYMHYFQKELS